MPRDLFPYEPDREVIAKFLAGKSAPAHAGDDVTNNGNTLFFQNLSVAWFDSAGALCAKLSGSVDGYEHHYASAIIDEILKQLGLEDRKVTQEITLMSDYALHHVTEPARQIMHFFDGQPIAIDEPVVLCGPLGVAAYRAANKGRR